jgi:hypothetical protein
MGRLRSCHAVEPAPPEGRGLRPEGGEELGKPAEGLRALDGVGVVAPVDDLAVPDRDDQRLVLDAGAKQVLRDGLRTN